MTQTTGTAQTTYGFTGETTDANGLVHLRARYYNPLDGRFMSRDTWDGDVKSPMSMNRWMYVEGNPVNYMDPTGYSPIPPSTKKEPCKEFDGKRYCILNRGGYIDVEHFYGGGKSAEKIINGLLDRKGVFNSIFPLSRTSFHVFTYKTNYITRIPTNIDNESLISAALGIFLDFEYNFEIWQLYDPFYQNNASRCSSFSNEDLPSDYLGFVDFVTADKDFDDIIDDLGGGWGSDHKPNEYVSLPTDLETCQLGFCGENTSRNTECTLKIYDPETRSFINTPWPSNYPYMNITPSGFGIYWGKTISDFGGQDLILTS